MMMMMMMMMKSNATLSCVVDVSPFFFFLWMMGQLRVLLGEVHLCDDALLLPCCTHGFA